MSKFQQNHLPVAIEAEEALLGCLLLDSEAIKQIIHITQVDHFSLMGHQIIYECALNLHNKEKIVDLMNVSIDLEASGKLSQVGGMTKLSQLVNRTVSSINADRYALLLLDKYRRRKLIELGHILVNLGQEESFDMEQLEKLVKSHVEDWTNKEKEVSRIIHPIEINYQQSVTISSHNSNDNKCDHQSDHVVTESVSLKTITNSVRDISELVSELKQRAKNSLRGEKQ